MREVEANEINRDGLIINFIIVSKLEKIMDSLIAYEVTRV